MNHLIDFTDFTLDEWHKIIQDASDIEKHPNDYSQTLSGKILGTLFFEPSTRTKMSFETAMYRLGGQVIGFSDPSSSSTTKGESLSDTIKIVSNFADIIAIRHPKSGAAKAAALSSYCPIINAGDGDHLHPTQTLTDLVTIHKKLNGIKNFTIGFCGDLKYGRTVHSLVKALCNFDNIKFVFISTSDFLIPEYIKDIIKSHGNEYYEDYSLTYALPTLDILYSTRIQKERFIRPNEYLEDYNEHIGKYILDKAKLQKAKDNMLIMHPLPREDEIHPEVDGDKRAIYFEQARLGVYARMSLMLHILKNHDSNPVILANPSSSIQCKNEKCITQSEIHLPNLSITNNNKTYCEYCEKECK